MGIVAEFKKFDAILKNPNWSVSSMSTKNELVVSLWGYKPLLNWDSKTRTQIYKDCIDRWSGNGRNEFKTNLDIAFKKNLNIRAVIVMLNNSADFINILNGADASQYPKEFNAKQTWIGVIEKWDGINFEIHFKQDT